MTINWISGAYYDYPEGRPLTFLPACKQRWKREKTKELLFASGWINYEKYSLPKDALSAPWSDLPERTKKYVCDGSYLDD